MPQRSPSPADNEGGRRLMPFSFLLEHESHPVPPVPTRFTEADAPRKETPSARPLQPSPLSWNLIEWALVVVGIAAVLVGAWSLFSAGVSVLGGVSARTLAVGPGFASVQTQVLPDAPVYPVNPASTTPASGIVPTHIDIPAIGVHASVEQVGKNAKGNMGTPSAYDTVAWYAPGVRPGAPGSAALAGHLNNSLSTAGVFANLGRLRPGDTVALSDSAGNVRVFSVTHSESYPADTPPDARIFAAAGPSQIALITCDGAWDGSRKEFDTRLVVFATLARQ